MKKINTINNAVIALPKFLEKEYHAVKNPEKWEFLPNGNIKLGAAIWSWSTLMGDYEYNLDGQKIAGTCGNCQGCKNDCYVRNSYNIHGKSVIPNHAKNTLGLRNNLTDVFRQLDAQITRRNTSKNKRTKKIEFVRINQSGEIESEQEFSSWIWLSSRHPETKFYVYTKMYEIVTPYLLAGMVPENLTVLFSLWHEIGVNEFNAVKHLNNVKAFVYDDGILNIEPDTYCMAYNAAGKLDHDVTCDKCGKCLNLREANKKHKIIGCKAH